MNKMTPQKFSQKHSTKDFRNQEMNIEELDGQVLHTPTPFKKSQKVKRYAPATT